MLWRPHHEVELLAEVLPSLVARRPLIPHLVVQRHNDRRPSVQGHLMYQTANDIRSSAISEFRAPELVIQSSS